MGFERTTIDDEPLYPVSVPHDTAAQQHVVLVHRHDVALVVRQLAVSTQTHQNIKYKLNVLSNRNAVSCGLHNSSL